MSHQDNRPPLNRAGQNSPDWWQVAPTGRTSALRAQQKARWVRASGSGLAALHFLGVVAGIEVLEQRQLRCFQPFFSEFLQFHGFSRFLSCLNMSRIKRARCDKVVKPENCLKPVTFR